MTDTSSRILDIGQQLIQARDYTAMGFQDVAVQVGFKEPSVIHFFARKSVLGVAITWRHHSSFAAQLDAIKKDSNKLA